MSQKAWPGFYKLRETGKISSETRWNLESVDTSWLWLVYIYSLKFIISVFGLIQSYESVKCVTMNLQAETFRSKSPTATGSWLIIWKVVVFWVVSKCFRHFAFVCFCVFFKISSPPEIMWLKMFTFSKCMAVCSKVSNDFYPLKAPQLKRFARIMAVFQVWGKRSWRRKTLLLGGLEGFLKMIERWYCMALRHAALRMPMMHQWCGDILMPLWWGERTRFLAVAIPKRSK